MSEKVVTVADLLQDDFNTNDGTERGSESIVTSIKEFGVGRPVLVDQNNKLIAGNKTQEAALKAGITKVRIIETTGDELLVHKRLDLDLDSMTDNRARGLAIADNRIGQISYNPNLRRINQQIQQLNIVPATVGYTVEELKVVDPRESEVPGTGSGTGESVGESYQVIIECGDEQEQRRVFQRMQDEGYSVRLLTI